MLGCTPFYRNPCIYLLVNFSRVSSGMKGLTPYQKKNYACKMLYIYMLGYDVDFGHMEAVSLISASNCPEKQVGYIVASCLLNENHDFLRLALKTVRDDITGQDETSKCLALTMVGNTCGREFAESLAPNVQELLSSSCRPLVRKKAALCLLQLYRKNPDVVNVDGWADRMAQLLDERDLGVLMSSMSLLVALVSNNHEAYGTCLPKCVKILKRLVRRQDVTQECTYYDIPSPWLQVKTMRALQYFPAIDDPDTRSELFEVLRWILDAAKNDNENNNAQRAVLFEALALVMHLDDEKEMMSQCVKLLLGKIIAFPEPEPNIRYLGLKNMTRMLTVTDVQDNIKRHQAQIISSLKVPNIRITQVGVCSLVSHLTNGHDKFFPLLNIHRRALDLLDGMCDVTNAKDIVEGILQLMRKEMSLKAAILAEKFAPDLLWYVDVILQLIDKAGDFISDDIWFRVVRHSSVVSVFELKVYVYDQPYAATKVKEYLEKPAAHETMVKVSAYILGEYSNLFSRWPGCSPKEIFSILHEKLPTASTSTIPILLSAYAKILMHTQPPDQELQNQIWAIFNKYVSCIDVEIQQRAVEYFALSQKGAALMDILAEMPKFPVSQLKLVKKVPSMISNEDHNSTDQPWSRENETVYRQPHSANLPLGLLGAPASEGPPGWSRENETVYRQPPSANLPFGLLGAPASEGPPGGDVVLPEHNTIFGMEGGLGALDYMDIGGQTNAVQIRFGAEWQLYDGHLVLSFQNNSKAALVSVKATIFKTTMEYRDNLMMQLSPVPETIPSGDEVRCLLIVANLSPSKGAAILNFSYTLEHKMVDILHFANTLFTLKSPMSLTGVANLLKNLRIMIAGFDPSTNFIDAYTTFCSWETGPMLGLIRIENVGIDHFGRMQLVMTVASGDYRLTSAYVAQLHTKQVGLNFLDWSTHMNDSILDEYDRDIDEAIELTK
ncbi:hypothetical protein COLO4_18716 [Corchorus olitorius]|uniref:AP-2 complex subunit alpha n=1 Tax=Corchorus olitorius TaxID=93759 RepID=A0A1R3J837_9ROSI|nr:hypothetical protein COLO4_18716 [Corchorus olitorius]